MAIFSIAYSVGSASNISQEDSKSFVKEFEHTVEGIDALGIFAHNISVALPMFVPGFGIAWGSFAAWSTGLAFRALVSTTPALAKLPPLAIIYLSPFGVMELIAYSIGMSRSFLLLNTILKRRSLRQELRPTIIEIGIVFALLLGGAFIEYTMIQEFGSPLVHPKTH
ncbi:MAG: stage II sporulation protein M [Thaumarchaeota archaeon]|nr:stage II sporulation protein M [Nitrososphaerota archaeon]